MKPKETEIKKWLENLSNVSLSIPDFVVPKNHIASGGQGVVYRGIMKEQDVAIKIYLPGQVQERIDREIKALKKLNCYSIVKWLWDGKIVVGDFELIVVVTEYVNGVPLHKIIKARELDENEISIITYDVTQAIKAMWGYRAVHRDLKPSNIILKPNGRAMVIDLGLARHLDESSITQFGATWGTIGYLSPEQFRTTRQLTCKSDIFALGVIILECALGRHPTSKNQQVLEATGFHEQLPELMSDWTNVKIIKNMLHPRPTARPKPEEIIKAFLNHAPNTSLNKRSKNLVDEQIVR
ncbi:serine/threonine-protein kinase [Candidatus Leptofilum sp.]|uniref:serine/threonine-protein kinase n=1 Tax=Candidatus Leptofilum sp. TaxID=3241576 RepID=UPI003B5CBD86